MKASASKQGYPWRYSLFVGLYFSHVAVFQNFSGKFYQQCGQKGSALLSLLVALPAIAMFAQPFWGRRGDRMKTRNSTLVILCVSAALTLVIMSFSASYLGLLVTTCLYAFFFTPIQPIGDSIILEDLSAKRFSFGSIRLIGSLTFAGMNLLLGGLLKNRYYLVPPLAALVMLGMLAATRVLPTAPGHQRGRVQVPMRRLLTLPHMKELMLLVVALQLAMGYFYSYFTIHLTSLPSSSSQIVGLAYFISAVSELPFLLSSDRLFKRFGVGRLMVVSALMLTCRFLILALSRDIRWVLFSQIFHGGGFIVITVTMALYINNVVPNELRAGGQTLLSLVGYGIARVFGSLCGGLISNLAGSTSGAFLAMSVVCCIAFIISGCHFFRTPPINGEQEALNRLNAKASC